MIFIVVVLLLTISLASHGLRGPRPVSTKLKNSLFASFIVLGHYQTMEYFWWFVKTPDDAQPIIFHRAGYFPPAFVLAIWITWLASGILAVFVGFAVAEWRRWGRTWVVKIIPVLFTLDLGKFLIGAQDTLDTLTMSTFLLSLFVGSLILGAIFGTMYKFYSNKKNAEYFNR